jgi:hypothetical protein
MLVVFIYRRLFGIGLLSMALGSTSQIGAIGGKARLFLSRKLEQVCYTITKPELLAEIAD